MNLKNIICDLLLEEVQGNEVINAIKKRHEVSFVYDSGDGDPRGKRDRIVVQPVAYGKTKAGNYCFRAYQVNGSSETAEKGEKPIPGWRMFILDKVKSGTWKETKRIFKEPPGYNENGDNTMSELLVKADFNGSNRYEKSGLKRYNDEVHRSKVESNPYYDLGKNIKNAKMAPDYVMKNIKDTAVSKEERMKQWDDAMKAANGGNYQSASEMSMQKDFGDGKATQTNGPQKKNDVGTNSQFTKTNTMDYSNAAANGPVKKQPVSRTQEDGDVNDNNENELNNEY